MPFVATKNYAQGMTPDAESRYDRVRHIRVPDEEWGPFGDAAKARHPEGRSPRAKILREFMRWYMRRPGASLPKRPDVGPWSSTAD